MVTVSLANEAVSSGHQATCIVVNNCGAHKTRLLGSVRIVELPSKRLMSSILTLKRTLKKVNPDFIISNMTHENIICGLASLGTYLKLYGVEHNNIEKELYRRKKINLFVTKQLIKLLYPRLDGLICVSKGVAKQFEDQFGLKNIYVVYNPIELEEYPAQSEAGAPEQPYIVGMGRLTRQKNFSLLIDAFALFRTRKGYRGNLVIAGEGDERYELEERARKLGIIEYVQFAGFVQSKSAFLRNADLLVVSSLWEGFGNVIVEALGTGTKVVSTNCEFGPSEILDEGKFGTLCNNFDAGSLSESMAKEIMKVRSPETLKNRAKEFSPSSAFSLYLEICK